MKRILMWAAIVSGLILLVVLMAKAGSNSNNTPNTTLDIPVVPTEHTKGSEYAPITLVEYSDFQCPACASTYPLLKQVVKNYPDDVRVVYRHFPLRQIHPQAQLAGQAAEAAAIQGKFWEMHDVLFNTQDQWANNPNAEQFFIDLAGSLGLDTEQFSADMNSKEARDAVNKDYASGAAANIPGTPSIFLNGRLIQNPRTYAEYETLINNALQNS